MERYRSLEEARAARPAGAARTVSVGFFDGVHRGHRKLIGDLHAWARERGEEAVIVTFDRHPQAVLGGHPPVPVVSLEHRLLLLEREHVEAALVLPFDRELAAWPPERFVREVLLNALGARALLLGFDSAFGRGRQGNDEWLEAHRHEFALELRRVPAENFEGAPLSSTRLRRLLGEGRLDAAREVLGRRFSLLGRVVHGEHRGRELGFPTANLDIGEAAVLPRGVYFADARILADRPNADGGASSRPALAGGPLLPAVVNVGHAPTFGRAEEPLGEAFDPARDKVEVHIPEHEGDLYGRWLEVFIDRKHRGERRFDSVEELARQIAEDVRSRKALAKE